MSRKIVVKKQKGKKISIACALITCALFCQASANTKADIAGKDSTLQIYLPREITIKDDIPKLGQVGIIRGEESLVARANEITLGRISVPGQEIAVDRTMVLSRLACNGIPVSKVALTGAEKVTVKRQQQIIKGDEFVEVALAFLKKNLPDGSACQSPPVRIPTYLIIPGASEDIKLSPRLAAVAAGNQAKIRIAVFADSEQIDSREVTFRLRYSCRRAVTLVELDAGATINPGNIKIEKALSNYPEPVGWKAPYGLIARRRLPANTIIHPGMVCPAKPAVIVGRNQNVIIRIERPGLSITAIGKTMQKGCIGEYIKVRNMDSKRIILVKVNEDGTVEPVF